MFQLRHPGGVTFYRKWTEYKNGFGSPNSDYWLGNDKIHDLTSQKTFNFRVDLTNASGLHFFELYDSFNISDGNDNYTLSLGSNIDGIGMYILK